MNKVIFLDVDGVLNDRETLARAAPTFHSRDMISCVHVARVNQIIITADTHVCISSSWRKDFPDLTSMRAFFHSVGIDRERIVGRTPGSTDGYRGREIEQWLKDNPSFVSLLILDDGDDMEPFMSRLVQTKHDLGIQDHDVEKAIKLLNE